MKGIVSVLTKENLLDRMQGVYFLPPVMGLKEREGETEKGRGDGGRKKNSFLNEEFQPCIQCIIYFS